MRKFHITTHMASMISWNAFPDKAFLLSRADFSHYCYKLLQDKYSKREITRYIFDVKTHTKSVDEIKVKNLEENLSARLIETFNNNSELMRYSFDYQDAFEAVVDFLEVYKYNEGSVSYVLGSLDGHDDRILSIRLHREQGLIDKLTGRLGKVFQEINVLESDVINLSGNANDFKISLKRKTLHLTHEGVSINEMGMV